jgi:hypothetical protein
MNKAGWPNGKALDYESRDCRFDPCVGHSMYNHYNNSCAIFVLFDQLIGGRFLVEMVIDVDNDASGMDASMAGSCTAPGNVGGTSSRSTLSIVGRLDKGTSYSMIFGHRDFFTCLD